MALKSLISCLFHFDHLHTSFFGICQSISSPEGLIDTWQIQERCVWKDNKLLCVALKSPKHTELIFVFPRLLSTTTLTTHRTLGKELSCGGGGGGHSKELMWAETGA